MDPFLTETPPQVNFESLSGTPPIGVGLPVAVSNKEGRVESYWVFTEKASQPRREGTNKHQILPSQQGAGDRNI